MEKNFPTCREIPWLQGNSYQTLVYVWNLDIALFPPWIKKNSKNNNNNNTPKNHSQLAITKYPPPATYYALLNHHPPPATNIFNVPWLTSFFREGEIENLFLSPKSFQAEHFWFKS